MSLRSAPLPPEPPALAPGTTVPLTVWSVVLAGTTLARSDSAACQSKRAAAIALTVLTRVWAS